LTIIGQPHDRPTNLRSGRFLYGVIAFAPADPARDAGILRTPDAIREAVKLFEKAVMYAVIPRGTDPTAWAAKILEARARAERVREETRARRAAEREDERSESAFSLSNISPKACSARSHPPI